MCKFTLNQYKILSEFSISPTSSQWELINQALAESYYLLKGEVNSRGFYQYQYCEVPKGYEMHCTKSVLLWRTWWKYRKYTSTLRIPLELLVRKRDSWYTIRDLIISDGLLYIKTLGSEIALDSDDLVTWLSKVDVINIIKEIPTTETQTWLEAQICMPTQPINYFVKIFESGTTT